jgi:hypothetical protein
LAALGRIGGIKLSYSDLAKQVEQIKAELKIIND